MRAGYIQFLSDTNTHSELSSLTCARLQFRPKVYLYNPHFPSLYACMRIGAFLVSGVSFYIRTVFSHLRANCNISIAKNGNIVHLSFLACARIATKIKGRNAVIDYLSFLACARIATRSRNSAWSCGELSFLACARIATREIWHCIQDTLLSFLACARIATANV